MTLLVEDDFTVTTIDLLRHGQCEGGEIFRGSSDVPLTETGWEQMQAVSNDIQCCDYVFSSSLIRCRHFSEWLSIEHAKPLSIFEQLREIHFGDWEGEKIAHVASTQKDLLSHLWRDPVNHTAPNGESMIDFSDRVRACFDMLISSNEGKHLLFVTHGAVIRVLICQLLKMPLSSFSSIAVPYACLTRFKLFSVSGKPPWLQLCFHRG